MSCKSLSTESQGLLLLLISAILFSGMGVFLKFAANYVPSTQLVFFRAVFQGFFILIGMLTNYTPTQDDNVSRSHNNSDIGHDYNNEDIPESKRKLLIFAPFGSNSREIKVVIARGILGSLGFVMYFYSISSLPLGDAITLFSLYPIHTLFLAKIFLNEDITPVHIIATVTSVLGAICIAGPTFLSFETSMHTPQDMMMNDTINDMDQQIPSTTTSDPTVHLHTHVGNNYNPLGYITAFLGSFFGAFVLTLIRKAGTLGVSALQLLFSWSVFGILMSILSSIFIFQPIEGSWKDPTMISDEAWYYILCMCSLGTVAHFLMNYAGRMVHASLASIVRSSDIVFAYIWEVTVFHVVPTKITFWGVSFVLLSLILVAIQKSLDDHHHRRQRILEEESKKKAQLLVECNDGHYVTERSNLLSKTV